MVDKSKLTNKLPPPAVAGESPPFSTLDPYTFQKLCCAIILEEDGIKNGYVYGKPGQAQYGIDVIGIYEDETFIVLQCKRYQELSIRNLKDASSEFLTHFNSHWATDNIKEFILFVSCEISDTKVIGQIKKEKEKFSKKSIKYDVWHGNLIAKKLSPHPAIVTKYFMESQGWIERICGVQYNNSLCEDHTKLIRLANQILEDIKTNIKTIELSRTKISEELYNYINTQKTVIVKGDAGLGKSALAKNILSRFSELGWIIIAFKADSFAVRNLHDFEQRLNLNHTFDKIINDYFGNQKIIILIDSMEKLLDVADRNAIHSFLRIINKNKEIKLVITCRSFALNPLIIDFCDLIPAFQLFDVPKLNQEEIIKIEKHFPKELESIPERFKTKVLSNPFYIDKIISNAALIDESIDSEKSFYYFFWNKIIIKNNVKRGKLLTIIAKERAISLKNYIQIDIGEYDTVLSEMISDGIISKNIENNYAPSHDIFEDFGLITHINNIYNNYSEHNKFIKNLDGGKSPAIRRAFRLWLGSSLEKVDYDLNHFINNIIDDNLLESFWKDELICSLLLSDYLEKYLDTNKEKIIAENGLLFLKMLKMLKISCQQPNHDIIYFLDSLEKNNYYDYLTTYPYGDGWDNIIKFYYKYKDELIAYNFELIDMIANSWSQLININNIPSAYNEAGKLLLDFIESYKTVQIEYEKDARSSEQYEKWKDNKYKSKKAQILFDSSVEALYKLANKFPKDIVSIIEESLNREKTLYNYDKSIIEKVSLFTSSPFLCKYTPDIVCKTAKEYWLNYNEVRQYDEIEINGLVLHNNRHIEIDEIFGLNNEITFNIMQALPTSTFVIHLLNFNLTKGIVFLVDIFNHSISYYQKYYNLIYKDEENPIKIELTLNDKKYSYWGNQTLWSMYRGTYKVTPNLLQSLLMALEKTLLKIVSQKSRKSNKIFEYITDYILTHSNNVCLISVLVSIANFQIESVCKNFLPIFSCEHFYSWDFYRRNSEHQTHYTFGILNDFEKMELRNLNLIEHRKHDLSFLIQNLQAKSIYKNEIWEIIDELKKSTEVKSVFWEKQLTEIDLRNWQVDEIIEKEDKHYLTAKVKYSKDVINDINKHLPAIQNDYKIIQISNQYNKIIKDNHCTEEYNMWKKKYKYYKKLNGNKFVLDVPILLAIVGINYFLPSLNKSEQKWCIETIFNYLKTKIKLPWENHIPQAGSATIDAANSLSYLYNKVSDEINNKILIFLLMLLRDTHTPGLNDHGYLAKAIHKIENQQSGIIDRMIAALTNYYFILPDLYYKQIDIEKKEIIHKEYLNNFLNNSFNIKLFDIPLDNNSRFIFRSIIPLLPFISDYNNALNYFLYILEAVLKNEKRDFILLDLKYDWSKSFVNFIFYIDMESSKNAFLTVTKYLFEIKSDYMFLFDNFEIYTRTFDELFLYIDANENLNDENIKRFNLIIESVYKLISEKSNDGINRQIIPKLFLSCSFWKHDASDWKPLNNTKYFYQRLFKKYGLSFLNEAIDLFSGIGFRPLSPDSASWIATEFKNNDEIISLVNSPKIINQLEKYIKRIYYLKRNELRESVILKKDLLIILNLLVELNSSIAFIIRDRVISLQHLDDIKNT